MAASPPASQVVYRTDLDRASRPLKEGKVRKSLEVLANGPIEACARAEEPAIACAFHPFIAAVHQAYADHRPLVLSPDMFWLLIAQGFAKIVNEDPEGMRRRFVRHSGKVKIEVRRDEFIVGSTDNDWPGVFTEFSEAVRAHIGVQNHEALVASFSTTGQVEKAANEIVFLEAMQSYFEYRVVSVCGIPEVVLEGTPEDWQHLAERARNVGARYDCGWWLDHVMPWLDRVAASASGSEDPMLWESIYKLGGGSGGPYAGGWIVQFFPFLQSGPELRRNAFLGMTLDEVGFVESASEGGGAAHFGGVTTDQWPGALSVAPFLWKFERKSMRMQFLAGFTHCTQDAQTLAVRPAVGWAVQAQPDITPPP